MRTTTRRLGATMIGIVCAMWGAALLAEEPPGVETVVHSITGLFQPDREADLRETLLTLPEIELASIDYAMGEATLRYDRKKAFNGGTDAQVIERLDSALKQASRHTFGAKPRAGLPREQLALVEIPVVGVDCKGCALAAYEAVYKLDGVERATASFHDGLVTALIDPAKTNRGALEAALKARNVALKPVDGAAKAE